MLKTRTLASIVSALSLLVSAGVMAEEDEEWIVSKTTRVVDDFNLQAILQRIDELGEPVGPIENGDVNADGEINVSDPIHILNFLLRDGPRPAPLPCVVVTPRGEDFEPLESASIRLELDELAWEAEVMISVEHDEPLSYLVVHDPDGNRVAEFRAEHGREIGLQEIDLESDDATLEEAAASYPEGEYLFRAVTASGAQVARLAILSHDLLPAPLFEAHIDAEMLVVQWPHEADAEAYTVELEQDDLDFQLNFQIDGGLTRFELPAALMRPGIPYELKLGSVAEDGNVTTIKTHVQLPAQPTGGGFKFPQSLEIPVLRR